MIRNSSVPGTTTSPVLTLLLATIPLNGARMVVSIVAEGPPQVLWDEVVSDDDFEPVRVDLAAWSGRQVRLVLHTEPGADARFDYAFLADPSYAVGLISPFPYLWWTDVDNPGIQYAEAIFATNERGPGEHAVGYLLTAAGVDLAVEAIKQAILTVGYENLTGQAVHDALEAMGPFEPLQGVMRVDFSNGNRSPHQSQIRQIQGGPDAFVVLQDWTETPDLRPTE